MSDYYGRFRTMEKIDMYEKYVEVSWCPADVKSMYPHWSDEQCANVLDAIAGYFNDRQIELGWEVLDTLTSSYDVKDDDDFQYE